MNTGAKKESAQARSRSDSYRESYGGQRYQSRSSSSRYGSASSRYGASNNYDNNPYSSGARERQVSSERISTSRTSVSGRQGGSYRESYGEQRYQSRSSTRYGSASSRYGASQGYGSSGRQQGARERQASAVRSSSMHTSGMQRAERRTYQAERGASGYTRRTAAPSKRRDSAFSGFAAAIMHYLRIANVDILGRRKWKLMTALYLPLACFYSEILLGLFCGSGLSGLIYKLFFSLSAGLVLGGIALLFKGGIQKAIVRVELFLLALLFIVQCLLRKEFQVYFSLGTILGTATDVMGDYGGDIVHSILTGIPAIILFMLPLIVYCIKTRKGVRRSLAVGFKKIFAIEMIVIAFILWSLGMLSLAIGGDSSLYKSSFDLTASSDSIGLLTGFRLNEKYTMFGDDASEAFEGLEVIATPEPVPTPSAEPVAPTASSEAVIPVATQAPYGENSLDIDFAALNAGTTDENIHSINAYLSTLTASNQNAYTGLFEGKNLIMICAEALSDVVIDPQLTPTLYRLTHNGIYFSQAYQPTWGGSTSTGEYSMLLGLVPSHSDIMADTVGNNNYFTMASQLGRIGYNCLAYHNGSYTYYDRNVTHPNLGFDQYTAHGNGMEDIAGGYPSDEEMMSNTFDLYLNQQPFCVYYMTVDGHKPYNKNKDSRVTEHLEEVLAVYPNRYNQETLNYICYQLELEDALTALVAKLENAGIADDTVICICSDHYPYGLNRDGHNNVPDLYGYTPQHSWERDHNSIIIWSGCLENENRDMACEISAPTYSLDILPTLSNLFGLEYDSRLMVGRDVFSDEVPLVFWKNGTWVTDRGYYDAEEKVFYPTISFANEDEYIQIINSMVKYKKSYSKLAVNTDYFQYIADHLAQKSAGQTEAQANAASTAA